MYCNVFSFMVILTRTNKFFTNFELLVCQRDFKNILKEVLAIRKDMEAFRKQLAERKVKNDRSGESRRN